MLYRIYLGPYRVGRVKLTYYGDKIERGTKIRVTPEEAAEMDKLPKSWGKPIDATIKVTKKTRKRKTRKQRGK